MLRGGSPRHGGRLFGTVLGLTASIAWGGALGPWRDTPLAIDQASPIEALADVAPPQCATVTRGMTQLPHRPDLYSLVNDANAWGSPYLSDLVLAVTEEMALLLPDADPVLVGDISRRGGGPLFGHISHQQGIDVDLGLYTRGGKQNVGGFPNLGKANLDFEASWLMIKSLLDSGRIEFILLDRTIIGLLRAWTVEQGRLTKSEAERIFPPEGTPHLWERSGYVRHADNHRDHIHVQVRCANGAVPP